MVDRDDLALTAARLASESEARRSDWAVRAQTGQWGRRRLEVLDLPDGTEVEGRTNVGFETRDERVSAWLGRLLDFVAA